MVRAVPHDAPGIEPRVRRSARSLLQNQMEQVMEPGVIVVLVGLAVMALVARAAQPAPEPEPVPVRVDDEDDDPRRAVRRR